MQLICILAGLGIVLLRLENVTTAPANSIDSVTNLAEHPACKEDVKRLCDSPHEDGTSKDEKKKIQHNFEVLECLLTLKDNGDPPSHACQAVVYDYKLQLTLDDRFTSAAKEVCKDFIQKNEIEKPCHSTAKGHFLPCLIEHAYQVDDEADKHVSCYKFLNKMELIIFSDYHLVSEFFTQCGEDIKKFECGRIFNDGENKENESNIDAHNQGYTVNCLQKHPDELKAECKHEIMRITELQADDFHLDRALYFACKHDREVFCAEVQSGQGRVYDCLMKNQQDNKMSSQCKEQLVKREQLMQEDMKADKGFYMHCKEALDHYGCEPSGSNSDEIFSMSKAILCLRKDYENEDGKTFISKECANEMEIFQTNLLSDYHITPDVVHECGKSIQEHCSGLKKADDAEGTIHCLMGLAMPSHRPGKDTKAFEKSVLSSECLATLNDLVEEANPIEHTEIDRFLMKQCDREIQNYCQRTNRIIDCLLGKVSDGTLPHSNECVQHVLELEYFSTRNFQLDRDLVHACNADMRSLDLNKYLNKPNVGPAGHGIAFAQLWKYIRLQIDEHEHAGYTVSKQCIREVLRIAHERAVSIDLNPDLEDECLPILSKRCMDARPGEELQCLLDKYDEIDEEKHKKCKDLVGEYIKAQDADAQLDYILTKSCEPTIRKFCQDLLDKAEQGEVDEGEIMDCLIEHKYDAEMDPKCFVGVEHHQLLNMKSYNFNTKFREACKTDYEKYCYHKTNRVDVILCLSEVHRNDTLLDAEHRLSDKCREQLTVEALRWEDTVQLDPAFEKACSKTRKKFCAKVEPGPGEDHMSAILGCLREHDLDDIAKDEKTCARYLHKMMEDTNMLAGAGAPVFEHCKRDIKRLCQGARDPEHLMACLNDNYDDLSPRCKKAVNEEEEQDNQDIRLNPALYIPCKTDIRDFCGHIMQNAGEDDDLHGAVIECLKMEYVKGPKSRLSNHCTNQMHLLAVRVQNRDYRQDYVLTHECKNEIKECSGHNKEDMQVIDCLKEKLFKGELKDDPSCQNEVFRLITENRVDIFTDHELYDSCRAELARSPCGGLPAGNGRVMSCLLSMYESNNIGDPHCRDTLKRRKELWEKAAKLSPPQTLSEVWNDLSSSSSRWYFFTVILIVILVILVVGILFGRFTKRVATEIKNR